MWKHSTMMRRPSAYDFSVASSSLAMFSRFFCRCLRFLKRLRTSQPRITACANTMRFSASNRSSVPN